MATLLLPPPPALLQTATFHYPTQQHPSAPLHLALLDPAARLLESTLHLLLPLTLLRSLQTLRPPHSLFKLLSLRMLRMLCPPPPPPILRLPTDVWLHIFHHLLQPSLPLSTLAALSRTCRHLLHLVDEHGWRLLLADYAFTSFDHLDEHYKQYCNRGGRRSKSWFAARYAVSLQRSWEGVVMSAGSVPIQASVKGKVNGRRRTGGGGGFAIPTLTLTRDHIVVGVRLELILYDARSMGLRGRVRLNSGTGNGGEKGEDDPWQDITALQPAKEGTDVVVGFADGTVQVVSLPKGEVVHTFEVGRREEVADLSVAPSSLQTKGHLIASVSQRGLLRLHSIPPNSPPRTWAWTIDSDGIATPLLPTQTSPLSSGTATPRTQYRSAGFNNAPLSSSDPTVRAWSILLSPTASFVAIGATGEHAVHLYPLSSAPDEMQLGEPWYVASTGQRTSAYALATAPAESPIPDFLLFVGFYDGIVRVYDTRPIDSSPPLEEELSELSLNEAPPRRPRKIRRELNPIAVFNEDFDSDAIYSLTFAGPRGTLLVVGGARHSKVKVFDVGVLEGYDLPMLSAPGGEGRGKKGGDWTAFAVQSTDSPQYGVVGEGERVVGVTQGRVWWFDFGRPILQGEEGAKGEEERDVAYFRHVDGELRYSTSRYAF